MCTEEFIRMMFTVDLYGNCGLDSRSLILAECRPEMSYNILYLNNIGTMTQTITIS